MPYPTDLFGLPELIEPALAMNYAVSKSMTMNEGCQLGAVVVHVQLAEATYSPSYAIVDTFNAVALDTVDVAKDHRSVHLSHATCRRDTMGVSMNYPKLADLKNTLALVIREYFCPELESQLFKLGNKVSRVIAEGAAPIGLIAEGVYALAVIATAEVRRPEPLDK